MEDAESPLDVLSRAATMLQQENQQSDTTSSTEEDSSKGSPNNKQTTKWKRDRRRLPEYSRKSDPKVTETLGEPPSPEPQPGKGENGTDTPLDMSVRHRGLPPSYAQTMSNPVYRSGFRPSVIQNGVPPPAGRDQLPSGISMCDPIIDEHFRRSLGEDYHILFKKDKEPPKPPTKVTTIVTELMDSSGLSVDDHFAKALGDTWAKLNKKDDIKSSTTSENNLVSISN